MATLSQKIKITLDETRMLVLGTQVLMMLQFELPFQSAFGTYPPLSRQLAPIGLCLLVLAFIVLESGAAYHRIACGGRETLDCNHYMTGAICSALWPVGLVMGLDAFIAFDRLFGRPAGIAAGCAMMGIAWFFWEGLGRAARKSQPPEVSTMKQQSNDEGREPELHEQVNQVLTEARVILPGGQAMLGFQFITMFTEAFWTLPLSSKLVHLLSLCMIALTVILLIAPAAFHRIAEGGEDSRRLVRVASRFVISALVPLAIGISGDLFVVIRKVTGSTELGAAAAATTLVIAMGLWFGYTLYRRRRRESGLPGAIGRSVAPV